MKELDSYCGTIDNTIYAYVKNYHTCSGILSIPYTNYHLLMGAFSLGELFCHVFFFFCGYFRYVGAFLLLSSVLGPFSLWGTFLGRAPGPSNKISAGAHAKDNTLGRFEKWHL